MFGVWQFQAEGQVFVSIDPVDQVPGYDTHTSWNALGPNIAFQLLDSNILVAALFLVLVFSYYPDYKKEVSHNQSTN